MADDRFKAYQTMRADAESDMRNEIQKWLDRHGSDDLTLGQCRDLEAIAVGQINRHTRQVYDMAVMAPKKPST